MQLFFFFFFQAEDGIRDADVTGVQTCALPICLSRAASSVLERAFKEADVFKDEYVSTEHLLLAIADQKGDSAQRLLAAQGATRDAILQALTSVRGNQRVTDQNPEAKYQALERYARDLTDF